MYNKSMTKLPAREQAPEVRRHNFAEVSQGYDEAMAREEATRCICLLYTSEAACIQIPSVWSI